MKLVIEGGLIIGALDGVDQEIPTESGESVKFILGDLEMEAPDSKADAAAWKCEYVHECASDRWAAHVCSSMESACF